MFVALPSVLTFIVRLDSDVIEVLRTWFLILVSKNNLESTVDTHTKRARLWRFLFSHIEAIDFTVKEFDAKRSISIVFISIWIFRTLFLSGNYCSE